MTTAVYAEDVMAKADELVQVARERYVEELGPFVNVGSTEEMESVFAAVPVAFGRFGQQNTSQIKAMIESLEYVIEGLRSEVNNEIGSVKDSVEDWQGNAAAFEENFLVPFPTKQTNQLEVAEQLRLSLVASRNLVFNSRKSLIEIGDRAIDAINGLEDDGGGGWGIVLAVVGAVAAVAGTAVAGPGAWALGLSLVSAGVGIASAAIAETSVQGGSVEEVLSSTFDAIHDLRLALHEEERVLADCLIADQAKVTPADLTLTPPTITTTDTVASGDFRLPPDVDGD